MADNVAPETISSPSSAINFKTDEESVGPPAVHVPYTKLIEGADGTFNIVGSGNPLPVEVIDVTNTLVADVGTIDTSLADLPNVIGTDGSAGPSKALSIGGTDGTGNFREQLMSSSGHAFILGINQEDVASSHTAYGMPIFAVRDDTLTAGAEVTADGDYTWLRVDNLGQLHAILSDVTATDGSAGPWKALSISGTDSGGVAREIAVSSAGAVNTAGAGADHAAVTGAPVLSAGRYDAVPGTRDDGDVVTLQTSAKGALMIAGDSGGVGINLKASSTGFLAMSGAHADNAAITTNNPVLTGGRYDTTPATRGDGDATTFQTNATGSLLVDLGDNNDVVATGNAADNAAASGNPVLMAGRYDITPATRGDGDVTTLQLNSAGELHVDIENATGVSGSAGPSKALSIAGTDSGGTLRELFTSTSGHMYVVPPQADDAAVAYPSMPICGRYDITPTTRDDGDAVTLQTDATGTLFTYPKGLTNTPADGLTASGATVKTTAVNMLYNGTTLDYMREGSVAGALLVDIAADSAGIGTEYTAGTDTYLEATTKLTGAGAVRKDSAASLVDTDNELTLLQVDSSGALRVTGAVTNAGLTELAAAIHVDDAAFTLGTHSGVMAMGFAGTQSVNSNDAAALACETDGSLHIHDGGNTISVDWDGTAPPIGAGTEAAALRVTLATDSTGQVKLAAGTAEIGKLAAGAASIGTLGANSGIDIGDVTINNASGASAVNIQDGGNIITVDGTISAALFQPTSHYRNIDANAEAAIKSSAGTLHWIHAMNMTAAVAYLHLYDAETGDVTPGTTVPDFTFPIPTQGDTNGAGFAMSLGGATGQSFTNAITLVVTTTTDGSTGDPGTNGVFINAGYR